MTNAAYIEQLEQRIADLLEQNSRLERERDAYRDRFLGDVKTTDRSQQWR